jgi:DNA-binding NarL/FixJ family response regulator
LREGSGLNAELLSAAYRLPRVDDPLIRSSFLQTWSYALTFVGRYQDALEAAEQELREAEQNRLAFVKPHGLVRRAMALRGLKRYREALQCLAEAQRDRIARDDHLTLTADSARVGVLLALGDVPGALAVAEPDPDPSLEGTASATDLAELIAIRGLALACGERLEEAEDAASRSVSLTHAAEPQNLVSLTRAVTAIVGESPNASKLTLEAFAATSRSHNIDALVTAYRAFPPLLRELAATDSMQAEIASILRLSNDLSLGKGILPASKRRRSVDAEPLTPREKEVLSLVSEGLRNKDIGQRLFISEVTVKVHVRNIMRKLGARSRAHAVSLGADLD